MNRLYNVDVLIVGSTVGPAMIFSDIAAENAVAPMSKTR
jgi:hypothetical protein